MNATLIDAESARINKLMEADHLKTVRTLKTLPKSFHFADGPEHLPPTHVRMRQTQYTHMQIYAVDTRIFIGYLSVKPKYRRQGHGTATMMNLVTWADKHNVDLHIRITPGVHTDLLSREQLAAWFQNFGFVWLNNDCMIRRIAL